MQPFTAVYTRGNVVVPTISEAESLYQDGYGSRLEGLELTLESFEVLYQVERGKLAVIDEETRDKLSFRDLLTRFSGEDKNVWIRFIVYRDLRDRGFVVKRSKLDEVGLTVYRRGMFKRQPPAYHIHIISEGSPEALRDLKELMERVDKRDRSLRLAVSDRRGEIVYYSLSEMDFDLIRL